MQCEGKRRIKKRLMPAHIFVYLLLLKNYEMELLLTDMEKTMGEAGLENLDWNFNSEHGVCLKSFFFQSVF